MILIIDTTKREEIILGLYDGKILKYFELEIKRQSEDLLLAINGILKNNKLSLKDIKAIVVNQGPGSFTGTRVGITIGNTLAWNLNIPICGFKKENLEDILAKLCLKLPAKFTKIIPAKY